MDPPPPTVLKCHQHKLKIMHPSEASRAPVFCCWLNAVYLSLSQLRITAKRMSMKVMGERTENEGWASLRIITRGASTRSASMSVKLHPQ